MADSCVDAAHTSGKGGEGCMAAYHDPARLRRLSRALGASCAGASLVLVLADAWLVALPLALWIGWLQLNSP